MHEALCGILSVIASEDVVAVKHGREVIRLKDFDVSTDLHAPMSGAANASEATSVENAPELLTDTGRLETRDVGEDRLIWPDVDALTLFFLLPATLEVVHPDLYLAEVLVRLAVLAHPKRGRFVVYRLPPEVFRPRDPDGVDQIDLGCCRLELPRV